jgi:hypothetical protein
MSQPTSAPKGASRRGRGRPSKFGRPSRAVSLTLPEDVIQALRRVHRDLGWAIVKLLADPGRGSAARPKKEVQPDVELVAVADRRYLIVINQEAIRTLPGVTIVPLSGARAFLALDVDCGMSDLELAVIDRLRHATLEPRERQALTTLRTHLGGWRGDATLHVHTRAILVVERLNKKVSAGTTSEAKRSRRVFARTWARPAGVEGLGVMPMSGPADRAITRGTHV